MHHAAAFIDTIGLSNVHLVGHSRGGYLVTRLTLEFPELVRSCTIVDSGTLGPGVGLNEIVHAQPPHEPLSRECQRWTYEKYSYSPDHITDSWLDAVVEVGELPKTKEAIRKMEGRGPQGGPLPARAGSSKGRDPALDPGPEDEAADPGGVGLQRPPPHRCARVFRSTR